MREAIPRTGRFGVICSSWAARPMWTGATLVRSQRDFEATYVGGAGARCDEKDARLPPRGSALHPRANEVSQIKSML